MFLLLNSVNAGISEAITSDLQSNASNIGRPKPSYFDGNIKAIDDVYNDFNSFSVTTPKFITFLLLVCPFPAKTKRGKSE